MNIFAFKIMQVINTCILKLELPSFPLVVGKNREENDLNELDDKVRSSSLRNIHLALSENSMPQEIIVVIIPPTPPTKW